MMLALPLALFTLAFPSALPALQTPDKTGDDPTSHARASSEIPAAMRGVWRATLASPGGEVPFELTLDADAAHIRNGSETVDVPDASFTDGRLTLSFTQYDAAIVARLATDGRTLDGTWTKRTNTEKPSTLPFYARIGEAPRFKPETGRAGATLSIGGRWKAKFASSTRPAVAVLTQVGRDVEGTFLTNTGDLGYLAGAAEGDRLLLSRFDGAHAYLLDARVKSGKLVGEFFAGDTGREAWTAERDEHAELVDPWNVTHWDDSFPLPMLVYPDLAGQARSLGEWQSSSKALMLVVFGSWCPNCHDEMHDLAELDRRLRPRGLSIVGLAFEHTGDFARDTQQVRRAALRHRASYPLLLAGRSERKRAAEALPPLSSVEGFPTTIFLHRDGRVRAVHTGYSGPSTGAAHTALLAEFEKIAQELIDEPDPVDKDLWPRIASGRWIDQPKGFWTTIFQDDHGGRFLSDDPEWQPDPTLQQKMNPVRVLGASLWLDERLYCFDRLTPAFLDPFDSGHRLSPESPANQASPVAAWSVFSDQIDEAAKSPDPRMRREALFDSVRAWNEGKRAAPLDPVPFLDDADVLVRCQAAWAAGQLHDEAALPKLIENASHGFGPLRRECAHAMGGIGVKSARPALERLIQDPDPLVRVQAQTAIGSLDR